MIIWLILMTLSVIQGWFCKKKVDASHFEGLKSLRPRCSRIYNCQMHGARISPKTSPHRWFENWLWTRELRKLQRISESKPTLWCSDDALSEADETLGSIQKTCLLNKVLELNLREGLISCPAGRAFFSSRRKIFYESASGLAQTCPSVLKRS